MPTMPEPALASLFPPSTSSLSLVLTLREARLERRSPCFVYCIYSSKVGRLIVLRFFNTLQALSSCICKCRLKFSAHLQHWTSVSWSRVGDLALRDFFAGARFQNLGRLGRPNRLGATYYQKSSFWQVARSCYFSPLESGVPVPAGFSYLCGEQFWGRAVRASRDSLNPGRFLFVGRISGPAYAVAPSRMVTSSLCPDKMLRYAASRII